MTEAELGWTDFNVAMAGVGAALAGLIIVAMSVNIQQLLRAETLPARGAASIGTLILAVAAACLGLMPAQPTWLLGLEILAVALAVWLIEVRASQQIVRVGDRAVSRAFKIVVGVVPLAVITVGALILLSGSTDGAYAVAIGSVLAFIGAVLFAWVALVEILR